MISVLELRKWAEEHAIGRSVMYPHGWVKHEDLFILAKELERKGPNDFYQSLSWNFSTKGE